MHADEILVSIVDVGSQAQFSHHCLVEEHMAQQLVALPAFQNHFPWERRCIIHRGCWFSWGGGGALLHHNRGGWGEGSCGSQAVWTGQTFTVQLPCLPLWPRLLLDAWKADRYLLAFCQLLSVIHEKDLIICTEIIKKKKQMLHLEVFNVFVFFCFVKIHAECSWNHVASRRKSQPAGSSPEAES